MPRKRKTHTELHPPFTVKEGEPGTHTKWATDLKSGDVIPLHTQMTHTEGVASPDAFDYICNIMAAPGEHMRYTAVRVTYSEGQEHTRQMAVNTKIPKTTRVDVLSDPPEEFCERCMWGCPDPSGDLFALAEVSDEIEPICADLDGGHVRPMARICTDNEACLARAMHFATELTGVMVSRIQAAIEGREVES